MMYRIQVSLPPDAGRRARARAAELGVSFAEYVRRLVERDLGAEQPRPDPSSIFDLGTTRDSDIAREKRRSVGEAVEARH